MHNRELHVCRVCGLYYQDFFPWGETGKDPSRELCDCCGVEFGYEDSLGDSCRNYRKEWINNGAKWFDSSDRPKDWNLEEQLKNIPAEYR